MGKKIIEYRTVETNLQDLEDVLNDYSRDRFKPIHFLPAPETGTVMVVFCRKLKHKEQNDDPIFSDEG